MRAYVTTVEVELTEELVTDEVANRKKNATEGLWLIQPYHFKKNLD